MTSVVYRHTTDRCQSSSFSHIVGWALGPRSCRVDRQKVGRSEGRNGAAWHVTVLSTQDGERERGKPCVVGLDGERFMTFGLVALECQSHVKHGI